MIKPSSSCQASGAPSYTTSSLTVLVQISCESGLSLGAIVGVIVGSVCGGILLVGLIVLTSKYLRNAATTRMQKELKEAEFDNLTSYRRF